MGAPFVVTFAPGRARNIAEQAGNQLDRIVKRDDPMAVPLGSTTGIWRMPASAHVVALATKFSNVGVSDISTVSGTAETFDATETRVHNSTLSLVGSPDARVGSIFASP